MIGPLGLPDGEALTSIAFDDGGLLYGRLESGALYTLDTDSGRASLLAEGTPGCGQRPPTTRDGTIVIGGRDDKAPCKLSTPLPGRRYARSGWAATATPSRP